MRNKKYLWSLLPGFVVIMGNMAGGWFVCANIVFSLLILGIAESLMPENTNNDNDQSSTLPDFILILHVIMQVLCLATLGYTVSLNDLTLPQVVLASISTGVNSGASAIIVAHELIHRPSKLMRRFGIFLLFTCGNIYFYVNHLRIHHKWVGTAKDPATSRLGESVYRFFFRTTYMQIKSSYDLEQKRLRQDKKSFIYNYVVWNVALLTALLAALHFFGGTPLIISFLIQSMVANFLLEFVNYIEHYGLTRAENERVNELHSWQSDKIVSRYFLIDLSRHADHHYYASKPYHTLNSHIRSPRLPGGYVQMIYYALIPPLWFKATHKILRDLQLI